MPEKKRSQKKNLRRWLSSWPVYIIGKARQGLPLAHLPVGTVVSTVRLGDHSVGKALASCPFSSGHCHSQDIWNKHQVALIWKFWCCSLCSPSASACWCSWRLPLLEKEHCDWCSSWDPPSPLLEQQCSCRIVSVKALLTKLGPDKIFSPWHCILKNSRFVSLKQ